MLPISTIAPTESLSSIITHRLSNFFAEAKILASHIVPSQNSPSPTRTYTLEGDFLILLARAMPVANG